MAAPVNQVLPAVTGTAALGNTLTTDDGTWDDPAATFTYEWLRGATPIVGATFASYALQRADLGFTLAARVTATNVSGATAAVSADSSAVPGTLIVETGSGVPLAESYISVAGADGYHAARNNVAWATCTLSDKEAALRKATDFMVQRYRGRWAGTRTTIAQVLDWPRYNVPMVDTPGGYGAYPAWFPFDTLPLQVLAACAELALKIAGGTELNPDLGRPTIMEKVGPIEVQYASGSRQQVLFQAVDEILSPLLRSNSRFGFNIGRN